MKIRVLDMAATVLWLGMDTLWAFSMPGAAINFGVLLVVSQLLAVLVNVDKPRHRLLQEAALLCWALMNVLWVAEDWFQVSLTLAKIITVGLAWTLTIVGFWKYGMTIKRIGNGRN